MNISSIKTPGVYINEIDAFPPSVAQVATAVPAFVGFTENAPTPNIVTRVSSFLEFQQLYGGAPQPTGITVDLDANSLPTDNCTVAESKFKLYNSMQLFYANGGGECYIQSIGLYAEAPAFDATTKTKFITGVQALEKYDEPTLLLFPDAVNLAFTDLGEVQKQALMQCQKLMDRFVIMDVKYDKAKTSIADNADFRDGIGTNSLKYGAAYYPYLTCNFPQAFRLSDINTALAPSGGFKQFFPNDTNLKANITSFESLHTDVSGLKTSSTNAITANKLLDWTPTVNAAKLNANLTKSWNLIKVFAKPNDLTNTGLVAYTNSDLISIALKPVVQKLIDFRKAYEKLAKPDASPITALALTINDGDFNGNWGLISAITESVANEYDGKLSNLIPVAGPVPAHNEPDFVKIQAELNKLHTLVVNTLDTAVNAVYKYELVQENNLIAQMPIYGSIVSKLSQSMNTVPPSGAIAGIYAQTDGTRGVWKAPANVSINGIVGLTRDINDFDQEPMNIHETGKSINAIRKFTGKGFLVWGARTLDGNSNDWRYINVRRLANMIEESAKKACMRYVFEPNVSQTWVNVKGMIENYLTSIWNDGALAGAKPEHAFFVAVGINQTMTAQDILEGRLIVKIGYAPSRPAEFIILEFKQMQQKS
ncbi:phage tail sheath C-terminal domain-containing protein [Flavobacterium sp. N3904]|uniref:phage tail sheath C-terminal domain-containing protein n=1 Tax=Flavobacterium sp. N3904 TaxID=2986835 RepID=UPI0022250617|nr:phage tail sheath C-terminal domain-containing protein [Flavobacterium sp. N3904]